MLAINANTKFQLKLGPLTLDENVRNRIRTCHLRMVKSGCPADWLMKRRQQHPSACSLAWSWSHANHATSDRSKLHTAPKVCLKRAASVRCCRPARFAQNAFGKKMIKAGRHFVLQFCL